jgi:ABC-2 type transport system ATP-binding protein
MLEITGLEKSYGPHQVLRGVDLQIAPGQILALLGPNGAGKTTLASIVAGLRRADAGSIRVGGVDAIADPRRARPLLGLAPQALGIYPTLTARRNLTLFGELSGLARRDLRRRIDEVAAALDLSALLDRRTGVLSGGQQRRLHTAMAMLHRPRLLFLDEPTVGADVESRRAILTLVKDLAADGCAVCYATHYLPEIEELDATVAVLDQGRIITCDSVENLVANHGTSGLRLSFRGDAPDLPGFQRDGSYTFRTVDHPGRQLAATLSDRPSWVSRLDSVEVIRPDLERAYLALTGHQHTDPHDADRKELTHVA